MAVVGTEASTPHTIPTIMAIASGLSLYPTTTARATAKATPAINKNFFIGYLLSFFMVTAVGLSILSI
jgi:hypothetical protein